MQIKTPAQVKQEFINSGTPVSNWATKNVFVPQEVYKVLNGQAKGNFGRAYEIAVALGLKNKTKVTVQLLCTYLHIFAHGARAMKNDFFAVLYLVLTMIGFSGWYFAENDNEILRQELSTYTGTEVRK